MIKVILILRKEREGSKSIEIIFNQIYDSLANKINIEMYIVNSKWKFFYDLYKLRSMKANVYHITGDVHYFTLFLPRFKTVLTIHDIGHFLNKLKGFKKIVYKWIWLFLPIIYSAIVTTISENTKKSIYENLKIKRKILVIPNCYSNMFHYVPSNFNVIEPRILQIGTQENKNLRRLILALKDFSCTLIIIGKLSSSYINWKSFNNVKN